MTKNTPFPAPSTTGLPPNLGFSVIFRAPFATLFVECNCPVFVEGVKWKERVEEGTQNHAKRTKNFYERI